MLSANAWPRLKRPVIVLIDEGRLRGLKALGAVLGLVQIALLWTFSIALYAHTPLKQRYNT